MGVAGASGRGVGVGAGLERRSWSGRGGVGVGAGLERRGQPQ